MPRAGIFYCYVFSPAEIKGNKSVEENKTMIFIGIINNNLYAFSSL